MAFGKFRLKILILFGLIFSSVSMAFADNVKKPSAAGTFYPDNSVVLGEKIDSFLIQANQDLIEGTIFALICPHAGYDFSGKIAAFGYKLIKNKPYKTVVIIGPSHYFGFNGVSVYPSGFFRTPLGDLEIDSDFAKKLDRQDAEILFEAAAFEKEHSVEVQLPFLQKVLSNFKIVPIVMGDCSFTTCKKLAELLKAAIADRRDVLVVASTDLYHGYDYQEAEIMDNLTLSFLSKMDAEALYQKIRQGTVGLCGGFPVVTTLLLSKELGHNQLKVLKYSNSAIITQKMLKGVWTVGYASCAIDQENKGAKQMLTKEQRKKLLEIARSSIETFLKTEEKFNILESDILLNKEMGAFVTLREHGQLRGCIGNLSVKQPLYLTIRDMAIEAATGDPRFPRVQSADFKNIEIEISVLSPLQRVSSADDIQLGIHGVVVRRGFRSGVFLPQVAQETGWTKEEFLSYLCAHKAGLSQDAWKDKSTELYVFTAEVFSEQDY